jgi:C1A family cysteine protease
MKKLLIILGVCLLLVFMPISVSDCGCNESDNPVSDSENIYDSSIDYRCGLIVPDNWWVGARFDPCEPTGALPERFDWRELGGCTSIKDQDGCGSCWAFSTVAPLECGILIKDGMEVDLSEQWLVSCNRDGWGCNGGWYAHDYHEWKTDPCGGTGAVLEENFPYTARDDPCNCPYSHYYLINDWAFIGGPYGIPPVDNIKQAIMDYGPVSVAVCVNQAFGQYSGGVFSGPTCHDINHAVAIVGWDDNQGSNGVWFLRNSWGPNWGEDGYMRIEYGVCDVGFAACYVDYQGSPTEIEITGGVGVTTVIENIGDEDLTDVECSVSVEGGLLGLIKISVEGGVPLLGSGEEIRKMIFPLGFGIIEITVTARVQDAIKATKTVNGLAIAPFVIIL